MNRSLRLFALNVVVLATLIALPSLASAAPTDVSPYPIDEVAYNACNSHPIEFTGTIRMASRVTQDASGVMHVGVTSNVDDFKGIDLVDGTSYIGVSTSTNQASFSIDPYTLNEDTLEAQYLMISQGGAPNVVAHTLIHLTFDADGRLTSSKFEMTSECP